MRACVLNGLLYPKALLWHCCVELRAIGGQREQRSLPEHSSLSHTHTHTHTKAFIRKMMASDPVIASILRGWVDKRIEKEDNTRLIC